MDELLRGNWSQRIRLLSGLILFIFAATHFLNTALGLFSIEAMLTVQTWRTAVTRSLVGSCILLWALLAHLVLGLAKVSKRGTHKMPLWEFLQIALGLMIPILLLPHIVNTRGAAVIFGVKDSYIYELLKLWPEKSWTQSFLLLIVWIHGCIGIHFWLRIAEWYQQVKLALYATAIAVPILSITGFAVAGREIAEKATDPNWLNQLKLQVNWPDMAFFDQLTQYQVVLRYGFALGLGGVVCIQLGRQLRSILGPKVQITYLDGPSVQVPVGSTLLEISRMKGIPHPAECGGRARCSTCRVRIGEGLSTLPLPSVTEATTLASIHAPTDVRLACQIRPTQPISVIRLMTGTGKAILQGQGSDSVAQGVEQTLAILFLDIRGFTQFSQNRLPYDVVYILNELFAAVGDVIRVESGWIDKYLGDGLMAVFGQDQGADVGCRQALRAVWGIDLAIDRVNRALQSELGQPFKVGMGIHVGPVVLGKIGHVDSAAITVIGRTVNTAARLESLTKEKQCQLIISQDVQQLAAIELPNYSPEKVKIRGLTEPLDVICIRRARDLSVAGLLKA